MEKLTERIVNKKEGVFVLNKYGKSFTICYHERFEIYDLFRIKEEDKIVMIYYKNVTYVCGRHAINNSCSLDKFRELQIDKILNNE